MSTEVDITDGGHDLPSDIMDLSKKYTPKQLLEYMARLNSLATGSGVEPLNTSSLSGDFPSPYGITRSYNIITPVELKVRLEKATFVTDEEYEEILKYRKNGQYDEYILKPSIKRLIYHPVQHQKLNELWEKALASMWTHFDIDFSRDNIDWDNLPSEQVQFFSHYLAYLASFDGLINENLGANFMNEVQIPEARLFYGTQLHIESIHGVTYSFMSTSAIKNTERREAVLNGIKTIPSIAKKADWVNKYTNRETRSFAERLVAFACLEGIAFSSSFAAFNWARSRGILEGMGLANEFISRDERLHQEFACELYKMLDYQLPKSAVYSIVQSFMEVEEEFVHEATPDGMIGMNADMMFQHVRKCADTLLEMLGYDSLYNIESPFDWIEQGNLSGKTNFFEKRVSEYRMNIVSIEKILSELDELKDREEAEVRRAVVMKYRAAKKLLDIKNNVASAIADSVVVNIDDVFTTESDVLEEVLNENLPITKEEELEAGLEPVGPRVSGGGRKLLFQRILNDEVEF